MSEMMRWGSPVASMAEDIKFIHNFSQEIFKGEDSFLYLDVSRIIPIKNLE
jgi:hypothetical protein